MSAQPKMSHPYSWLETKLTAIARAGWYRQPQYRPDLVDFGSNDYLGLARHPAVQQAAIAAIATYGTGATGSRLVTGHLPIHEELEQAIAQWQGTSGSLVFGSGYLTNVGVISALLGPPDLLVADAYNHNSLQMGARLSGATVWVYPHGNWQALAAYLRAHRHRYRRWALVTDSVFSMDGDWAPLPELLALTAQYEGMALVDEAHGTGVFGDRGQGLVHHLEIDTPLVHIGTLSKALGSLGGYVAGTAPLIAYLQNRAPTWIYTTGLNPAAAAAARAALQILQQEPERRDRLWQNVALFQTCAAAHDIPTQPIVSPIVIVPLVSNETALQTAAALAAQGYYVPAIRPPTVPTPRLRLTLSARHTPDQIQGLVQCLQACLPAQTRAQTVPPPQPPRPRIPTN
ncbi:MAG: aminotransferase class I/II-fold pyridoxal phosphate-dependent enzyme [Pseudanabaenaceae cyanobacterium]